MKDQSTAMAKTGSDLIHAQLKACGIKIVSGLPDDWVGPLMNRLEADADMEVVRVAREPEAVGVCGGAFFGGVPTCAVMGLAGLLACGHEFALFNSAHQVPLFVLSSFRGTFEDPRTYQVAQGLIGRPYLDSLQIPYTIIDDVADLPLIPPSYRRSRLVKRTFVCFLTKKVLFHGLAAATGE